MIRQIVSNLTELHRLEENLDGAIHVPPNSRLATDATDVTDALDVTEVQEAPKEVEASVFLWHGSAG